MARSNRNNISIRSIIIGFIVYQFGLLIVIRHPAFLTTEGLLLILPYPSVVDVIGTLLILVGGIIGILLGVFLATGLSAIGRTALGSDLIGAHFSFLLIFGALFFSFSVGAFFGVLPAYRASKLNPVDSIRYSK